MFGAWPIAATAARPVANTTTRVATASQAPRSHGDDRTASSVPQDRTAAQGREPSSGENRLIDNYIFLIVD